MPEPVIFSDPVWESGSKFPRARVVDEDGTVMIVNDFTACSFKVYNISSTTPGTAVFETNRTVATVMTNTLQTWDLDSVGSNFKDTVTTNEVSLEGGDTYRLSYLLTHTSKGNFPVLFEWRSVNQFAE